MPLLMVMKDRISEIIICFSERKWYTKMIRKRLMLEIIWR